MSQVKIDIKALLETGAHFGHKTSRWHPKMAPYIHSKRQDIHIIDLAKTVEGLERALTAVEAAVAKGGKILLVGTKKQVKEQIAEVAEATNQPYVNERWIGGMLTNNKTIAAQVRKLHKLEKQMDSGELEKRYNKLEIQRFQDEIDDLNNKYSGVKQMKAKPAMMFVVDGLVERNAINEANKLNIPVVAITDTNVNPEGIDFVIPANDDAIKGVNLILDYLKQAILAASKAEPTAKPAPKTAKEQE